MSGAVMPGAAAAGWDVPGPPSLGEAGLLTMKLCLLLVCLVATVTATVTPVSTPETTPSGRVKPIRLQPAQTVFPRLWDTGTPTQPVPSSNASTTEEPSLGAVLEALEPLGPVEFVAAPEESGTAANGSVATPEPETTAGPPSTPPDTINPPCPGDEEPAETCWAPTREQKEDVAMALGTFALRFYQHMAESAKPDTNLLFSPVNVALGLSHLLLGARGETQQRLAAILGYQPGLACVHSALQQLVNVSGLLSATEIFHHPDLHLRPRFLNESWRFYKARPRELSGNESLDLQRINEWVRKATHGLVPQLLSQLPDEPRLVLLSAVHFQARWQKPFKTKHTVLLPFMRHGHRPVDVLTMTSKKYPVASFTDPRLQVQVGRLELSGGLSLVVLVPRGPPEALEAVERALDPPTFLALLQRAANTPVRPTTVALPRLHLDLAVDVVAKVHDMDFGLFLDAELCGLAQGPEVAVDAAQHRAVLTLDEKGVEAAGAMATSLARIALQLEALQPFLFVLWDEGNAIPLFMGRLSDPQA
ncbi:plasma protease C1 inhibitor isoform X1 [Gallus gallus]|uniref:plasma protease C1 inhibitor isoform X1 n=2 Tax=Gallus gallus TaxID=9031 RepID=UPI001AE50989|nr:plasma protease C1 inhibitor isoform X1 [Gallus gallus]